MSKVVWTSSARPHSAGSDFNQGGDGEGRKIGRKYVADPVTGIVISDYETFSYQSQSNKNEVKK